MAREYTVNDTLNSISWQLKRIADNLDTITENLADKQTQTKTTVRSQTDSSDLLKFINNLK